MRIVRTAIIVISLLLGLFLAIGWYASHKYSNKIQHLVLTELNKNLNAKVNVGKITVSSFNKIPYLSLSFSDILILESNDFSSNPDTLLFADNLSFQFDLWDIYNGKYELKHLDIASAKCFMKRDELKGVNYQIWTPSQDTSSMQFSLKLNQVNLEEILYTYEDTRNKVFIKSKIERLKVKGDFSQKKLELKFNGIMDQSTVSAAGVYALKNQHLQINSGIVYDNESLTFELYKGNIIVDKSVELTLGGQITKNNYHFEANTNNAKLEKVLKLLPKSWNQYWKNYAPNGIVKINFNIAAKFNEVPKIDLKFDLTNGTGITREKPLIELTKLNVSGVYSNGENRTAKSSVIHITTISAAFPSGSFSGSAEISNFKDLRISGAVEGDLSLNDLAQFLKVKSIKNLEGAINFKLKGDIFYNQIIKSPSAYKGSNLDGVFQFSDVKLKSGITELSDYKGIIKFDKQTLWFQKSKGRLNSSQFTLNGSADNFFPWVFENDVLLHIIAQVTADKLVLEDFLSPVDSSQTNTRTIAIPTVKLQLSAKIDSLCFKKFRAKNVTTKLLIEQKKIVANPIQFEAMDGSTKGRFLLKKQGIEGYKMTYSGNFDAVNVKELFTQFDSFGQEEIKAKNIEGTANLKLDLSALVNNNFEIIPSSILANAHIIIVNGKLVNYKTLQYISDFFKTNYLLKKLFYADQLSKQLKAVTFDRLENDLFIKNSALVVPKMQLNSSVLNMSVLGEYNFNDSLNYKVNFDVTDLLIRDKSYSTNKNDVADDGTGGYRVFLLVTGTTDDIDIKLDKSAKKEYKKNQRIHEGKELKNALKNEFGWFEKDTTQKQKPKDDYTIEWEESESNTLNDSLKSPNNSKKNRLKKWFQVEENEEELFEPDDDDF